MKNFFADSFKRFYQQNILALAITVALVALVVDYLTGRLIHFPVFFLLPISLLAWNRYLKTAYVFSLIIPLTRIGFHFLWGHHHFLFYAAINATITTVVLLLFSYLFHRISEQKVLLERRVKIMEGILPICSVCRKIRNAQGQYQDLELYVTEHSELLFSHGFCPQCAREFYPELFVDKSANKKH